MGMRRFKVSESANVGRGFKSLLHGDDGAKVSEPSCTTRINRRKLIYIYIYNIMRGNEEERELE